MTLTAKLSTDTTEIWDLKCQNDPKHPVYSKTARRIEGLRFFPGSPDDFEGGLILVIFALDGPVWAVILRLKFDVYVQAVLYILRLALLAEGAPPLGPRHYAGRSFTGYPSRK